MATSFRPTMPEITMDAVDRMKETGRRAGGRERRGDLVADQPGLPDAGDDHAPRRFGDEPHGVRELLAEAPLERRPARRAPVA